MELKSLYQSPRKIVVTAHRGFSGSFPENTLTAFYRAVEIGADIVEFDVRETRDGELVILHDATLDRTTNGVGEIAQKRWEDIRSLNATYWKGTHNQGKRLSTPLGEEGIPLFEEALQHLAGKVGLNIQVYTHSECALQKIAKWYLDYDLLESGFLMLRTFDEAACIRKIDPRIAVCVGEQRVDVEAHKEFGVDFLQPRRTALSKEYLAKLKKSEIPFNVFFANTKEEMTELLDYEVKGILTDCPDLLLSLLSERKKLW